MTLTIKKKYRTVKCPRCSEIQVTSSNILICKFCGKNTTIFREKGRIVKIYDERDNSTEARKFIQRLKGDLINDAAW